MENEEQKSKKKRIPQDAPLSIRLSKEERAAFKSIAQAKGKQVSSMIRECCLAYLQNADENDKLIASLMPEDPKEVQKTFFDILNKNNEVVIKTLEQLRIDVRESQEKIEDLLRKNLFIQFYQGPHYEGEEYKNRVIRAKKKLANILNMDIKEF